MKPFRYLEDLDAFVITDEFDHLAAELGLTEWHAVVWIGRLLMQDNDYGEHIFDNWDEREALETRARALGVESHDLMIVAPWRFQDGEDGPCNPPETRRAFWTDVLRSLDLSEDTIFAQARLHNERALERGSPEYLPDLKARIARVSGA